MADIKKELNDIKNAVYGKEVRGAIHDGIKKINDEVENATDLSESAKHQVENIQQQVNQLVVEGDSSVEAAQARVDADGNTFTTLKERLDTKETQLANEIGILYKSTGVNIDEYPRLATEMTDVGRIQRALDDMVNGGVLIFNDDTYLVGSSEITIRYNNIRLIGKGKNTIFKAVDNVNVTKNGVFYADGLDGLSLSDLTFDGNNLNQTNTYHMVRLRNCTNINLENLYFRNIYGTALTISGCTDAYLNRLFFTDITGAPGNPGEGIYGQNIKRVNINNVTGVNIGDHLIYFDSTTDGNYSENVDFVNVTGVSCGQNEITNGAAFNICNDCRKFTFTNCHALNSRTGFYFHENGVTGLAPTEYSLMNCSAIGSTFSSGFYFAGPSGTRALVNAKIIGCISKNNVGDGTASGFRVENVEGITFTDCDAIENGYYGFLYRNTSRVRHMGGVVYDNGQEMSIQGIKVGGTTEEACDDFEFRAVTSKNKTGTTQTTGIGVISGSTNIKVIGGDFGDIGVYMDSGTGIYIPDKEDIKTVIHLRVFANEGDGDVTVLSGERYFEYIRSNAYGLIISLKNISSNIVPIVLLQNIGSNGMSTSEGSYLGYVYTRSSDHRAITLGLKINVTSGHIPLNQFTSGQIDLVILI